jgi:MFS family permease
MTEKATGARLGPIYWAPGITGGNGLALVSAAFFLGIVSPYINFAQPYILTEHLGIPSNEQGTVSGNLAFWSEVVLIALAGVMGAWSDKAGRRVVFTFGLVLVAISYVLYPLASSYNELLAYRVVFAVAMAAVGAMFVAVQAEYPADNSRGKLVGLMGIISILGVMFVVILLAPLPARFAESGATAVEAGRYAYWVTAGLALLGAVFVWFGLAKHNRNKNKDDESVLQRLRVGMGAARDNPRIALAYGAAFIGRTDLVVVVIFLSLWITQAGVAEGMTTQDALIKAGALFGVIQVAALLFAPVIGFLIDRISRVAGVALATAIAMVGYIWMGLLDTPMGAQAYPAAIVLGMGQVSAIVAATALVGQEASKELTGSISGAFNVFGAVGILLATKVGGWLFDTWMPGAPFIITGVANGIIVLAAVGLIWAGVASPVTQKSAS